MSSLIAQSKELINALNRYAHLGRMEVARGLVDVGTVLDEVQETLATYLREAGVSLRRTGAFPSVSGDAVLLREVFSNLVTNAIKYNLAEGKWVEIGCRQEIGAAPVFFVRDNGIGIRKNHHAVIFKMFRRLHPVGEFGGGTGAGLAIVKSIVERHGGKIWLESQSGEGSTFWFVLNALGTGKETASAQGPA